jgi:hypothetical protein
MEIHWALAAADAAVVLPDKLARRGRKGELKNLTSDVRTYSHSMVLGGLLEMS